MMKGRPLLHPTLVVLHHRGHPSLLKHHLRHPDGIGFCFLRLFLPMFIASTSIVDFGEEIRPPWEDPMVTVIPGQQARPDKGCLSQIKPMRCNIVADDIFDFWDGVFASSGLRSSATGFAPSNHGVVIAQETTFPLPHVLLLV